MHTKNIKMMFIIGVQILQNGGKKNHFLKCLHVDLHVSEIPESNVYFLSKN